MTGGIIYTKDELIKDIKTQPKYIKTQDNKSKIKFDYVVQISKLPWPMSGATGYDMDYCNITISENDINVLTTTDDGIKSKMQGHHNLECYFMVTTKGNFAIGLPEENEFYPDEDYEQYYLEVSIRRRGTWWPFSGGGKKTRIRRQRKSKRKSNKSRRRQRTR